MERHHSRYHRNIDKRSVICLHSRLLGNQAGLGNIMLPFIEFWGIRISMYGVCVFLGIVFSGILIHLNTKKRRDFNYIQIMNIPLFCAAGAFIGAKLLYFITRLNIFLSAKAWENFLYSFTEACGGMVFYGGLFGGVLTAYIYCRLAKIDFNLYADIYAPVIPLFHAFGRIGCFMAGCCYGAESSWGVVYHNEYLAPPVNDVTRLPIQLIEACLNIIIMLILVLLDKKRLKKGSLLALYFIIYAVVRFAGEFFRGDVIRGYFLFLSTSQWISIIALVIGIYMLLKRYVLNKDKYERRLPTGEVPDGYVYNRYAGAVLPDEIKEESRGE